MGHQLNSKKGYFSNTDSSGSIIFLGSFCYQEVLGSCPLQYILLSSHWRQQQNKGGRKPNLTHQSYVPTWQERDALSVVAMWADKRYNVLPIVSKREKGSQRNIKRTRRRGGGGGGGAETQQANSKTRKTKQVNKRPRPHSPTRPRKHAFQPSSWVGNPINHTSQQHYYSSHFVHEKTSATVTSAPVPTLGGHSRHDDLSMYLMVNDKSYNNSALRRFQQTSTVSHDCGGFVRGESIPGVLLQYKNKKANKMNTQAPVKTNNTTTRWSCFPSRNRSIWCVRAHHPSKILYDSFFSN